MLTVGIDMASQAERTAACRLQWREGRATILEIRSRVSDDELKDLIQEPADKIGIDVPLGWPTAFVEAVSRHSVGQPFGTACVHELAYRATDRQLADRGYGWPLSVSADRLAYPAMRAARLLGAIDRSGEGTVVEVYPALALRVWGLPHRSYKGRVNRARLEELLTTLRSRAPWLIVTDDQWIPLVNDDNATDALITSLVARSAALGMCDPIRFHPTRWTAPDGKDGSRCRQ